jgi:heavy metal sensor kinase
VTLPIRARLTLWYVGVLAVLLVAFGAGVSWFQDRASRAQLDAELGNLASSAVQVVREELGERHDLHRATGELRDAIDVPTRTIAVLDADGRPVVAHWHGFPRALVPSANSPSTMTSVVNDGIGWRIRVDRETSPYGRFIVMVAAPETPLDRAHRVLTRTLLISTPLALLCAALVCWWAASRAIGPVIAMTEEAEAITPARPDARLAVRSTHDEVGRLARAFNALLERLNAAIAGQRRFMADASHQLRTPLTAARTTAEVTLAQAHRSEAEYRDALAIIESQTRLLTRIVDDLLLLARADTGGLSVRADAVDLDAVATHVIETVEALARARHVRVASTLTPSLLVAGDDVLLHHMLLNVVENAVNHSPAGGTVHLESCLDHGWARLVVADNGPGIPEPDRGRIFDRFVALDTAHARGGTGLGLAIARSIAAAHGGRLDLQSSGPSGSVFVMLLPLAGAGSS